MFGGNASPPAPRQKYSNIRALTGAMLGSLVTGGTSYSFSLYGGALKKSLHISQSQLDTLSSAFFLAGFFSWIPGMFADKFGPRCAMSSGGFLGAVMLVIYWEVARGQVHIPPEYSVSILSIIGFLTMLVMSLVTGSVFKIIVTTCGEGTKGAAVGAAKGYVGLGAGAYAIIYQALKGSSGSALNFLPMEGFFSLAAACIPAYFLIPSQDSFTKLKDYSTARHYRVIYGGLILLGSLVVIDSVLELYDSVNISTSDVDDPNNSPPQSRHFGLATFIVAVWFVPILSLLCVPTKYTGIDQDGDMEESERILSTEEVGDEQQQEEEDSDNVPMVSKPFKTSSTSEKLEVQSMSEAKGGEVMPSTFEITEMEDNGNEGDVECFLDEANADVSESNRSQQHQEIENKNLIQMLQTVPAWLLLYTVVVLGGAGTLLTNNMSQMVESLDLPLVTTSAGLSFFSVAQSLSRVLTGIISESVLNWNIGFGFGRGVPRPVFLIVASLISFVSHACMAYVTTEIPFVICATISGFAFGMIWPIMVLVVGECFGKNHVGANYMFYDGTSNGLGTVLLSKFVAQTVYENHIHTQANGEGSSVFEDGGDDGMTCFGSGCFQLSHIIVAVLSLSCVLSSICMVYTTRHVYRRSE